MVLEVDAAAKKLKLGTKPSYLPGYQKEESQPDDKVTTDSASDMDKEVLEAMANLSDAGSDWRTASGDEGGPQTKMTQPPASCDLYPV